MQSQPNQFHPHVTERLFLAVVNQAIADFLANGKEAKEAERWLLSKDFDILERLFGQPTKTDAIAFRNRNQRRPQSGERSKLAVQQLSAVTGCPE